MRSRRSPISPKSVLGLVGVSLLAGVATGCSSDVLRFQDGFYTGSDQMTTSSIPSSQNVPTPLVDTGASAGRLPAPQYPSGDKPMAQPFPAAVPNYDGQPSYKGVYTGSIGSSQRAVQGSALPPPVARSDNAPASAPRYEPRNHAANAIPVPSRGPQRLAMASPQLAKPAPEPARHAGGSYVVQSGDTLTRIASQTGVSIDALKSVNGLSGSTIRVGQRLTLPAGASAIKAAPEAASVVTASTPRAPTPAPEPQKVAKAEITAPAPEPKQAEPEPQPKAYSAPTQDHETVHEAQSGKELASLTPESTGIGKLRWPAHGQVVSKFGSQEDGHRNDGIDISVPEGTPIKAAENGVVIYAGNGLKEYGNTVLIRHDNGMVTVYGYAKDLKVKRGDKVTRGEVVAESGMSGAASRPKLHFEVRKDATPVNPLTYLD